MRINLGYCAIFIIANIFSIATFAQTTTINGNVKNSISGEPAPAVSITIPGSASGTFTDDKGNFTITVNRKPLFTLLITSVGFENQEISVNNADDFVQVNLVPGNVLGQEIVVSATRTPSRIMESPVTIERISAAAIRNSPATTYYEIIGNLKGVDVVTASLTFKSPSTRGFNGSGSVRVNQIMDGMDNQAPGLNFSVGSVVGLTELDVESVELLPGASSALYGPGGMNGAILITAKSPFKYQGLSFQVKTGIMHTDGQQRKVSPYYNWSLRWAKKLSERFAFKIGSELVQAKDWVGDDNRNYARLGTTGGVVPGTRDTDPNYDGINVYGDETSVDLKANVLNPLAAAVPFYAPYVNALPATVFVSRTGYQEKDVIDPTTLNFKLAGSLEYKIKEGLNLLLAGHWGTGSTVYTGSDRYSLKDLKIGQYKLELNHKNFFLRGYTTQENAGQSFNATVTTRLFNEAWKQSGTSTGWYAQYGQAFIAAKLGGASDISAHNAARATADIGRPAAGSAQFKQIFDKVRSIPISKGGGLFVDKTDLYVVEGQYNLKSTEFADIVIGGNYKRYSLNSEGTLFADSAGKIGINEVGGYIQATRSLLNDRLKFIVSGRFDKSQNFDGKFTPRVSAVIKVAPDNNIRLSYQTAYRFPSTQQQWINLRVGGGTRLLGGLVDFQDFYKFGGNKIYTLDTTKIFAGILQERRFPKFKAESVESFELGYKGLLIDKKLLIDIYGYYGVYSNFTARELVVQSVTGNTTVFTNPAKVRANLSNPDSVTVYSVPTNIDEDIKTYGFGIGLDYALPRNFALRLNVTSDKLQEVPANFQASFNAPLYRICASLANSGFGPAERMSFNVSYRWQDEVNFEGDFANGLVPAFHTVDAVVGYKFPLQKVMVKLGATNLLNEKYRNAIGNASVGGIYYLSVGYNLF